MNLTLSAAVTGLVSSIISEVFKLIPVLRANELTTALVAIVVVAVASWIENGLTWSWANFFACLAFALVTYKSFVQPAAKFAGSASQE